MKNYSWHRFMYFFTCTAAGLFIKRKLRYKCRKVKAPDAPSLIVSNHVTDFDPMLVALGISKHMYFLASEHALRAGFASKIMRLFYNPIPFNKTATDVSSIKEMMRRLSAGANVCVFPEGDRSFTGVSIPSFIAIAKLAKASGADLVTFRIEGGYFTWPRWSVRMRKGEMSGRVINKYPAAMLSEMTDAQVLEKINEDIYEDAYKRQMESPVHFRGKNLAESIETALYLCPKCTGIGTIRSKGDLFWCGCGLSGAYTETGFLRGEGFSFTKISQWGVWQAEHLKSVIDSIGDETICADEGQILFKVCPAECKLPVAEGVISIDRKALSCAGEVFPLEAIKKLAIVGQMTLLFALKDGQMYEVSGKTIRSALKYREIFKVLTEQSTYD